MLQIRAVLFDLDGTLLDRRETFRRHLERQIGRFGDLFGGRSTADQVERMVALDRNGETPRRQFYEQVEENLELPGGAAARLHDDFEAHFPEICVATPNAHRTLHGLRGAGVKLGLITNGRVLMQDRKIDRLDVPTLRGGDSAVHYFFREGADWTWASESLSPAYFPSGPH